MNKIQKNLSVVIPRLVDVVADDEYFASDFATVLEQLLDQYASNDGFGTERQSDPRGDFRDKEWSLFDKVQK